MKARKKTPLSSLFQQPSQESPPCKSQPQSASPFEGDNGVPAVPSGRGDQTNQMMHERWEEGMEHGSIGGGPRRRQVAAAPPASDRLDKFHRWSTYTADTSVTALESEDSFVKEVIGKEEDVCVGVGNSSIGDGSVSVVDVVLPSKCNGTTSLSSSRETSPSPSPEDSLNAALASMLSTANELLSSTMAARSDLARLQTIENALDAELDRREERILMEIQNNAKMSEWVENASLKLDRMLLDSTSSISSSSRAMRPSIMTTNWGRQDSSTAAANTATSSSKHWRSTSTTSQTVHTLDTNTSLGVFEAKDEHATISKSAAKRLEKVLQRANSNSPLHQYHHHQSSSPGPSRSRAASTSIDDPATTTTPTASRMKSSNNSNLSSKFGISALNGEATESTSSVVTSAPPLSARLPQPSEMAVASSSSSSGASTSVDTTPSITSDSAPDSTVGSSSRGDDGDDDDEEEARAALDNINDSLDPQQALFLTPPTPLEELPSIEDNDKEGATSISGVTPLTKRSISSLRSPNPLRTPGHASSGSFVSEAALGQMVLDENGRAIFSAGIGGGQHGRHPSSANGKGAALEALRRLNGGSSFGSPSQQTQQHQHNNQSSSSNGSAPPGWGGTFASWVGITSSPH